MYDHNNHRPLKKVRIRIDDASDNITKAVITGCEHLVLKKFCPFIVLALRAYQLDIYTKMLTRDQDFPSHVREKHMNTFEEFCSKNKKEFGKGAEVFVKPVFDIYITNEEIFQSV